MYCPDDIFVDRFEIEDPNPSKLYHLQGGINFREEILEDSSSLSEGEESFIMGVEMAPAEIDCFDLMMGR